MRTPKAKALLTTLMSSTLAILLYLVARKMSAGHDLDSDTLHVESLFRDLFVDHFPIHGWLVSKAPYFFPEWLTFFSMRYLTGDFISALFLNYLFYLIAFVLVFYVLLRMFFEEVHWGDIPFILFWILIYSAPYLNHGIHKFNFILEPFAHTGALLAGLIVTLYWLRFAARGLRSIDFAFLFLWSLVATASDLWWTIWFAVPLFLTSVILIIQKKLRSGPNVKFFAISGLGSILGLLLTEFLGWAHWVHFSKAPLGTISMSLIESARLIGQDLIYNFQVAPTFLVFLILASFLFWRSGIQGQRLSWFPSHQRPAIQGFHILTGISILFTLTVLWILKMWGGLANFRYLQPLYFLPWALVGIYVFDAQKKNPIWRKVIYCLSFFSFSLFGMIDLDLSLPKTKLDSTSKCIVKMLDSEQLTVGASEYWPAKRITNLSDGRARVVQLTYNFDPLHWVSNVYWYKDKNGVLLNYQFFIAAEEDVSYGKFKTLFGQPLEEVNCGFFSVLVFTDEQKITFNNYLRPRMEKFFLEFPQPRRFFD